MNQKAIHYIACDSYKYALEATHSADNFKKNSSGTDVILYTDLKYKSNVFDQIINIPNLIPGGKTSQEDCEGKLYFEKKIEILSNTKYEYNLYLDGDIITLVSIDDIFDLLKKFDIVVTHDSCRTNKWSKEFKIPLCFPDFNLGLFFFKKSTTINFFKKWKINYQKHPRANDQQSFRKTLWEDSENKFYVLPPEFNCRPKKFHFFQDPAIIHGRGENFLPEVEHYNNFLYKFI